MLTDLIIKQFALLDHLQLALEQGLTVITGETGAGKSITFDALGLALGDRVDYSLLDEQAPACDISAIFDLSRLPPAIDWLTDQTLLDETQPHECTIRRVIHPNGRSRCFINGTPTTTRQLRQLRPYLISIHGQHEHQALLHQDWQLTLLDRYAGHEALVHQVQTQYRQWQACHAQYQALQQQPNQQAQQQLLAYQVAELDALALGTNELSRLEQTHKQLSHAETHLTLCQQIHTQLADDLDPSLLTQLQQLQATLQKATTDHPTLTNIAELLHQACIHAQEAADELATFTDTLVVDPQQLTEMEQRLQQIHDLARKHQVPAEQLSRQHQQLTEQLTQLNEREPRLAALEQQLAQHQTTYQKYADQLTQSRTEAAQRLGQSVTELMHELALPGGQFVIELQPSAEPTIPHLHGQECLEFKATTNPGQPLLPLAKVASGGELSRISLAIQVLTAQQDATPTLLFDEVDVGIGGHTAAIVGRLLRQLSAKVQILCITHQPQVAAMGHHHLQVTKFHQQQTTHITLSSLNQSQRLDEIARMLGGLTITRQTKAHAQELLSTVQPG